MLCPNIIYSKYNSNTSTIQNVQMCLFYHMWNCGKFTHQLRQRFTSLPSPASGTEHVPHTFEPWHRAFELCRCFHVFHLFDYMCLLLSQRFPILPNILNFHIMCVFVVHICACMLHDKGPLFTSTLDSNKKNIPKWTSPKGILGDPYGSLLLPNFSTPKVGLQSMLHQGWSVELQGHPPPIAYRFPSTHSPGFCFDPSNRPLRSPRFDEGSLCLVKPWKISWKYPEAWASMVDDSPGNSNDHLNL